MSGSIHNVRYNYNVRYEITILMHLRMKRDVWLDNVKNFRQYILRYTVGAPTSKVTSLVIGWRSCFTLLTKLQFSAKRCAFVE